VLGAVEPQCRQSRCARSQVVDAGGAPSVLISISAVARTSSSKCRVEAGGELLRTLDGDVERVALGHPAR